MRLAEFIPLNMEAILVQWEVFAATLLPAASEHDAACLARPRAADSGGRGAGSVDFPDEASSGRQIEGASAQADGRPGDGGGNARGPAGEKRLRHQPTGRRVPRSARQRPSPVDGRVSSPTTRIWRTSSASTRPSTRRSPNRSASSLPRWTRRATCCSGCWVTTCAVRSTPSR